jgi:hypothetical protein
MIYVPVDIRGPIAVKKSINIQSGLTNNFPEIVFELHSDYEYVDLGDDCQLSAAVTNFDLESVVFSGDLEIMNPHRGQILCKLNYNDFSNTGINTLTIRCACEDFDISFQTTVFVQSISNGLLNCL